MRVYFFEEFFSNEDDPSNYSNEERREKKDNIHTNILYRITDYFFNVFDGKMPFDEIYRMEYDKLMKIKEAIIKIRQPKKE